ncbi:MAG: SEC-C metal-binding domain-containing protein, partial [Myxococcota bacterium]
KASEARQRHMQVAHSSAGPQDSGPAGTASRQQRAAAIAARATVRGSHATDRVEQATQSPAQPQTRQKPDTVRRERPKLGRNDPCWCGSGKKYKKCHWAQDHSASSVNP